MYRSTFIYPISRYKAVMDWITKVLDISFSPTHVRISCLPYIKSPRHYNSYWAGWAKFSKTYDFFQVSPISDPGNEIVAVGLTPKGMSESCIMAHIVSFQEPEFAALEALRPLDESRPTGALVELSSQPTSLIEQCLDQADANPLNHRYCADNAHMSNDSDITSVLENAFTTLPHRKSFALWFSMAPTSRRALPDMACSMQSDDYFALYTVWEDEKDDGRCKDWVKDIMRGVVPFSKGAYYLGDSDFQVRKTKFWTDEAADRLMKLRRKWDAKGIFSGYLNEGDISGTMGLDNQNWMKS
jgi:hypothetical protein